MLLSTPPWRFLPRLGPLAFSGPFLFDTHVSFQRKTARGQLAALETQGQVQSRLVTLLHQIEAWDINRHFISNLCLLAHRTTNPSVPLFNEVKVANTEYPECAPRHFGRR